jgi:menaquinone-dependent protoporphyrinogen oxidase
MRVLVAVASRHGATAEIAEEVAKTLRGPLQDAVVEVRTVEQVTSVDGYDAVVLGSAVYMGRWLRPARDLAMQHAAALAARPTWLFSSGPIGDPPKPEEDPVDAAEIIEATRARDHRVFAGKLDRAKLGFFERAVVLALRAPEGDFRDWAEIRAWAEGVADTLRAEMAA